MNGKAAIKAAAAAHAPNVVMSFPFAASNYPGASHAQFYSRWRRLRKKYRAVSLWMC